MRLRRITPGILGLLAVYLCAPLLAAAQEQGDTARTKKPSFWQAAGGVLAVNGIAWAYNWYVQRWHWANVGTRSWWLNLRHGFEWDNDIFMDNQLAHPYHGSLYLSSARASGYDFWQSLPYVAVGSLSWELFTENVRPSLNDLIHTTLGGIALGEVTYRLSSMLGSRNVFRQSFGREVGAFALNPIGRAQGLLHRNRHESESEAWALRNAFWVAAGRRAARDAGDGTRVDQGFVELAVQHGSPFDNENRRPYDAFEFRMQLSPEATGILTHLDISGLLARWNLGDPSNRLAVGLFQHYDYTDVSGFKYGGQSLSGALLHRQQLGGRHQLDLGLHLEAVVLGAMSSDHGHYFRRDYDYGPGAGTRLTAAWRYADRDLVRFDGRLLWLHSVHGSDGDHLAAFARLGAALPLSGIIGLGGDVGFTIRRSFYPDQPSVTQQVPQVRAYLMWPPS
jgi:hypothetical protein